MRRIMKGVNGLERVREDADIVVGGGLDCRLNGQENSVQFGRQYREGGREGKTSNGVIGMYKAFVWP